MTDLAHRRYKARTFWLMGAYVAVNVAAIFGAFDDVRAPGSYLLALAVAAPIVAHVWATLQMIRDSDEFVRAVIAKRFILAAGASMALFTGWGFMETYATAPHAPGWLIYALFWLIYSLVAPFVRTSR